MNNIIKEFLNSSMIKKIIDLRHFGRRNKIEYDVVVSSGLTGKYSDLFMNFCKQKNIRLSNLDVMKQNIELNLKSMISKFINDFELREMAYIASGSYLQNFDSERVFITFFVNEEANKTFSLKNKNNNEFSYVFCLPIGEYAVLAGDFADSSIVRQMTIDLEDDLFFAFNSLVKKTIDISKLAELLKNDAEFSSQIKVLFAKMDKQNELIDDKELLRKAHKEFNDIINKIHDQKTALFGRYLPEIKECMDYAGLIVREIETKHTQKSVDADTLVLRTIYDKLEKAISLVEQEIEKRFNSYVQSITIPIRKEAIAYNSVVNTNVTYHNSIDTTRNTTRHIFDARSMPEDQNLIVFAKMNTASDKVSQLEKQIENLKNNAEKYRKLTEEHTNLTKEISESANSKIKECTKEIEKLQPELIKANNEYKKWNDELQKYSNQRVPNSEFAVR